MDNHNTNDAKTSPSRPKPSKSTIDPRVERTEANFHQPHASKTVPRKEIAGTINQDSTPKSSDAKSIDASEACRVFEDQLGVDVSTFQTAEELAKQIVAIMADKSNKRDLSEESKERLISVGISLRDDHNSMVLELCDRLEELDSIRKELKRANDGLVKDLESTKIKLQDLETINQDLDARETCHALNTVSRKILQLKVKAYLEKSGKPVPQSEIFLHSINHNQKNALYFLHLVSAKETMSKEKNPAPVPEWVERVMDGAFVLKKEDGTKDEKLKESREKEGWSSLAEYALSDDCELDFLKCFLVISAECSEGKKAGNERAHGQGKPSVQATERMIYTLTTKLKTNETWRVFSEDWSKQLRAECAKNRKEWEDDMDIDNIQFQYWETLHYADSSAPTQYPALQAQAQVTSPLAHQHQQHPIAPTRSNETRSNEPTAKLNISLYVPGQLCRPAQHGNGSAK